MTSVLVVCDEATGPSQWESRDWNHRISVRQDGDSPTLRVRLDDVDAGSGGLPARGWDLVNLASYVYAADQEVSRGGERDVYGKLWKREFSLAVPVIAPAFWNQPAVVDALREALSFVSGDAWDFHFTPTSARRPAPLVLALKDQPETRPDSVLLFSGGSDSLCAAVGELQSGRRPMLVSQRSGTPFGGQLQDLRSALRGRFPNWTLPHYSAEIHRVGSDAKEDTQRTRSFLYASLGAAVANAIGADRALLSDNGIVSLNVGPNAQLVGTLASRSTHPKFLSRFNALVTLVFQTAPVVENYLWNQTRAETLTLLKTARLEHLLEETRSCAHPRYKTKLQPHCGGCSQCIDRRFGSLAAALGEYDPPERYELDIFRQALPEGEAKTLALSTVNFARAVTETPPEMLFQIFPELDDAVSRDDPRAPSKAAEVAALMGRYAHEVLTVLSQQIAENAADISAGTLPAECLLRLAAGSEESAPSKAIGVEREPAPTRNSLRLRGKIWQIVFKGEPSAASDSKGMRDLARLVPCPGEPVPAVRLYQEVPATFQVSALEAADLALNVVSPDAGAVPDDQAIEEYRQQILVLDDDIAEAERNHDFERKAKFQQEHDWLVSEVLRRHGPMAQKRMHRTPEEEKARKAVHARVSDALGQLDSAFPELAAHLRSTIRLGLLCSYQRDASEAWDVHWG